VLGVWLRRYAVWVVLGVMAFGLMPHGEAAARGPIGDWLTGQGGAVVRVGPCGTAAGGALCGRIVGIMLTPGTPMPVAWQGQSQCDFALLTRSVPDSDGKSWRGHIVDPRNGDVYDVAFHVGADGRLAVHGYLLLPILGETQYWQRYSAPVPRDCRVAQPVVAENAGH